MSEQKEAEPRSDSRFRLVIDLAFLARLALTLALVFTALLLTSRFLPALTWALVMAVVFTRPHRLIESRLRPSVAAALSVLIVALIVVAPLLFVSQKLIEEAITGATYLQEQLNAEALRNFAESHPWIQNLGQRIEAQFDLPDIFRRIGATLTNAGATIIRQSTGQVVTLALAFYLLFFFLRDRADGLNAVRRMSPFSDTETDQLIRRVHITIFAIIYGTLAVAALQGALGGLMFWWLEFPSPAFWALIMGVLAIVPVLGTFIVWIPATIFLAIEGRWAEAAILAVWGGVVIAGADNLVRPLLIGEGVRLHTASTFIAMLGGLQLFGAAGLVLGPIAMTCATLTLEFLRDRGATDQRSEAEKTG